MRSTSWLFLLRLCLAGAIVCVGADSSWGRTKRRPAAERSPAESKNQLELEITDLLSGLKAAPAEDGAYLVEKIYWMRTARQLCDFSKADATPYMDCMDKALETEFSKGLKAFCTPRLQGSAARECLKIARTRQKDFDQVKKKILKEIMKLNPDGESFRQSGSASAGMEPKTTSPAEESLRQLSQELLALSEKP